MPSITFQTSQSAPPDFAPAHGRRAHAMDAKVGKVALAIFCGMVSMGCFTLSLVSPIWLLPASATLVVALMALNGPGASFPRFNRLFVSDWSLSPFASSFRYQGGNRPVYCGGPMMAPRQPHFEPARASVGYKGSSRSQMRPMSADRVLDPVGRPVAASTGHRASVPTHRLVPSYGLPPRPHQHVTPTPAVVLDGPPRPRPEARSQRAAVRTK